MSAVRPALLIATLLLEAAPPAHQQLGAALGGLEELTRLEEELAP